MTPGRIVLSATSKKTLLEVGVVDDEVDGRADGKVALEEPEVLEHEGVVRHRQLLLKTDLYSGNDGHRGTGPSLVSML